MPSYDGYFVYAFTAQLGLYIKGAERVDGVAEEVEPVRFFVAITLYIHDAASDGILSGFEDEVHALHSHFVQEGSEVAGGDLFISA